MIAASTPVQPTPNPFQRAALFYRKETGGSLGAWILVTLLNGLSLLLLRHELAPGEFGTLNTALGVIALMTVPALAGYQGLARYLAQNHPDSRQEFVQTLRAEGPLVVTTFAWIWSALSIVLLLVTLPLLGLPRLSVGLFLILNVLAAMGGLVSAAIYHQADRPRFWNGLRVLSALARALAGAAIAWGKPWAESGLAALFLAEMITFCPVLRQSCASPFLRLKEALPPLGDRHFLAYLGATFSVLLALCLFANADRIAAQHWFGTVTSDNFGLVDWEQFDAYQTAGLFGRAVLWGTQPFLWILFAQRSRVKKTTAASLTYFWIYLGALFCGVVLISQGDTFLAWLFCGTDTSSTVDMIPNFAAAMVPLGLAQGVGVFALASQRYPECYTLGGCSLGYALLLYLAGRQPQLLTAYMFAGGLVTLMIVLFVGVVRWGRKQP